MPVHPSPDCCPESQHWRFNTGSTILLFGYIFWDMAFNCSSPRVISIPQTPSMLKHSIFGISPRLTAFQEIQDRREQTGWYIVSEQPLLSLGYKEWETTDQEEKKTLVSFSQYNWSAYLEIKYNTLSLDSSHTQNSLAIKVSPQWSKISQWGHNDYLQFLTQFVIP